MPVFCDETGQRPSPATKIDEGDLDEQLLAEQVGELAPDRGGRGHGQQRGGDDPGVRGLAAAEVADDRRAARWRRSSTTGSRRTCRAAGRRAPPGSGGGSSARPPRWRRAAVWSVEVAAVIRSFPGRGRWPRSRSWVRRVELALELGDFGLGPAAAGPGAAGRGTHCGPGRGRRGRPASGGRRGYGRRQRTAPIRAARRRSARPRAGSSWRHRRACRSPGR